MKARVHTYREYTVGDFFRMQRGHTLTANDKEIFKGEIPCINATTENNGIVCKLSPDIETIGFKLIKAPALSLGRVGSSITFLQTKDFYVADNAYALIPKQFSQMKCYYIFQLYSIAISNYILMEEQLKTAI